MGDRLLGVEIGKRVRELRVQADLTIEELAEESKLSRSFLWGLEKGNKICSISTLNRICTALNLQLNDFFNYNKDLKVSSPIPAPELNEKHIVKVMKTMTTKEKRLITKFLLRLLQLSKS